MRMLLMVVLLTGAGVGLWACGTPPAKCTASSCSGCCDATGQCQLGGSNAACGAGGAQCQPCANSQACTFGQCVTQNTSGGGAGGGSGGGTGGGAAGGGSGGGMTGGGTGGGGAVVCSTSSCGGCCTSSGQCQAGTISAVCGRGGQLCVTCPTSQSCSSGQCVAGSGGGGGATGGGGGSSCSFSTCPSGCCTSAGVCITNTTPSRCGNGGGLCISCNSGSTCNAGSCQPCSGCIDLNTGTCRTGTLNSLCGRNGGFCQACAANAGQTCQTGICSGGTTCNSGNCAGCCDGNTCVDAALFTNARCGQGVAGAACTACLINATCDALTGACSGGGTGGGGGTPFPDGGLGDLCALYGAACTATQCCDVDSVFGIIPTCYSQGMACGQAGICGAGNVCH